MRAFYEPIALTAFETDDIALALKSLPLAGRWHWHRAPAGIVPDVYVSHLRSADLQEDAPTSSFHAEQDAQRYGQSNNQQQRVLLDADGTYQSRPVCLLGENDDDHFAWSFNHQSTKAQELHQLLNATVADTLRATHTQHILTQQLLQMRSVWGKNHLVWQSSTSPHYLAAATVCQRSIWLHPQATSEQIGQAAPRCIPYGEPLAFERDNYLCISLWQALWDHIQRSITVPMHATLTKRHLHEFLRLHRTQQLPANGVGHAARYIIERLQGAPQSVYTIMQQHLFCPDELLRTLLALLLTRVIAFEKNNAPF